MLQFKRPKNKPIVNHFKSLSSGFYLDLVLASQDSSLQGIFLVKDQMDSGSFSLIRAVGVPIINAQSSKSDLPSPQPSQSCFIPDSGPRILGPFTPDIWVYMLSSRGGGAHSNSCCGSEFFKSPENSRRKCTWGRGAGIRVKSVAVRRGRCTWAGDSRSEIWLWPDLHTSEDKCWPNNTSCARSH